LAVTRSEERMELNRKKTPCEKDEENCEESAELKKWRYKDYVKVNEDENIVRNDRKEEMKITVFFNVKPCSLAVGY
jgi:hypothetical protein